MAETDNLNFKLKGSILGDLARQQTEVSANNQSTVPKSAISKMNAIDDYNSSPQNNNSTMPNTALNRIFSALDMINNSINKNFNNQNAILEKIQMSMASRLESIYGQLFILNKTMFTLYKNQLKYAELTSSKSLKELKTTELLSSNLAKYFMRVSKFTETTEERINIALLRIFSQKSFKQILGYETAQFKGKMRIMPFTYELYETIRKLPQMFNTLTNNLTQYAKRMFDFQVKHYITVENRLTQISSHALLIDRSTAVMTEILDAKFNVHHKRGGEIDIGSALNKTFSDFRQIYRIGREQDINNRKELIAEVHNFKNSNVDVLHDMLKEVMGVGEALGTIAYYYLRPLASTGIKLLTLFASGKFLRQLIGLNKSDSLINKTINPIITTVYQKVMGGVTNLLPTAISSIVNKVMPVITAPVKMLFGNPSQNKQGFEVLKNSIYEGLKLFWDKILQPALLTGGPIVGSYIILHRLFSEYLAERKRLKLEKQRKMNVLLAKQQRMASNGVSRKSIFSMARSGVGSVRKGTNSFFNIVSGSPLGNIYRNRLQNNINNLQSTGLLDAENNPFTLDELNMINRVKANKVTKLQKKLNKLNTNKDLFTQRITTPFVKRVFTPIEKVATSSVLSLSKFSHMINRLNNAGVNINRKFKMYNKVANKQRQYREAQTLYDQFAFDGGVAPVSPYGNALFSQGGNSIGRINQKQNTKNLTGAFLAQYGKHLGGSVLHGGQMVLRGGAKMGRSAISASKSGFNIATCVIERMRNVFGKVFSNIASAVGIVFKVATIVTAVFQIGKFIFKNFIKKNIDTASNSEEAKTISTKMVTRFMNNLFTGMSNSISYVWNNKGKIANFIFSGMKTFITKTFQFMVEGSMRVFASVLRSMIANHPNISNIVGAQKALDFLDGKISSISAVREAEIKQQKIEEEKESKEKKERESALEIQKSTLEKIQTITSQITKWFGGGGMQKALAQSSYAIGATFKTIAEAMKVVSVNIKNGSSMLMTGITNTFGGFIYGLMGESGGRSFLNKAQAYAQKHGLKRAEGFFSKTNENFASIVKSAAEIQKESAELFNAAVLEFRNVINSLFGIGLKPEDTMTPGKSLSTRALDKQGYTHVSNKSLSTRALNKLSYNAGNGSTLTRRSEYSNFNPVNIERTFPKAGSIIKLITGNSVVTSPYGKRWGRMHKGIDLRAAMGTPITTPWNGVISENRYSPSYGYYVTVDHPEQGISTRYAHLQSKSPYKLGQFVNSGSVIAASGNSGASLNPHLHFEILKNGKQCDPIAYLNAETKAYAYRSDKTSGVFAQRLASVEKAGQSNVIRTNANSTDNMKSLIDSAKSSGNGNAPIIIMLNDGNKTYVNQQEINNPMPDVNDTNYNTNPPLNSSYGMY